MGLFFLLGGTYANTNHPRRKCTRAWFRAARTAPWTGSISFTSITYGCSNEYTPWYVRIPRYRRPGSIAETLRRQVGALALHPPITVSFRCNYRVRMLQKLSAPIKFVPWICHWRREALYRFLCFSLRRARGAGRMDSFSTHRFLSFGRA